MKATIDFDLSNKEDLKAHKRCIVSTNLAYALNEVKNLRDKNKDELSFHSYLDRNETLRRESLNQAFDRLDETINEILSRNNINLDEIL